MIMSCQRGLAWGFIMGGLRPKTRLHLCQENKIKKRKDMKRKKKIELPNKIFMLQQYFSYCMKHDANSSEFMSNHDLVVSKNNNNHKKKKSCNKHNIESLDQLDTNSNIHIQVFFLMWERHCEVLPQSISFIRPKYNHWRVFFTIFK